MIDILDLKPKDVGRFVDYRNANGKVERGKIKSWNESFIFVVYKSDGEWNHSKYFTAEATIPKDLTFA
jgi:hypothetical protein